MTLRQKAFAFTLAVAHVALADDVADDESRIEAPSPAPTEGDAAAIASESHTLYTLEGVDVRGNERTLSRVIYALIPWAPGDRIDPEDRRLLRARYRLLATGYFRDVELSLRRGSKRGRVVLVCEVRERNTLIVESLVAGVGARASSDGAASPIGPFGGVEIVESNLAGTGVLFGAAAALANHQHALRLRVGERGLLAPGVDFEASFLTATHEESFGAREVLVSSPDGTASTSHAVYTYGRIGGSLGASMRMDADWTLHGTYRAELLDAPEGPSFASELLNGERTPIATRLLPRASTLGVVGVSAIYDSRDNPAVPSRGILARIGTDVAATPTGSDYPYAKVEARLTRWFALPWRGDTLRLNAFGGVVSGSAPLFERFNVGDLSDLLPDRVLGLTVDQRPAPNLLGTRIGGNRWGTVAAKLDVDYAFRLYRGGSAIESVDLYVGAGAYWLDDPAQLLASAQPPVDRSWPIDLTFDAGIRMVSNVGVFGFGVSNWLGLFPTELRP